MFGLCGMWFMIDVIVMSMVLVVVYLYFKVIRLESTMDTISSNLHLLRCSMSNENSNACLPSAVSGNDSLVNNTYVGGTSPTYEKMDVSDDESDVDSDDDNSSDGDVDSMCNAEYDVLCDAHASPSQMSVDNILECVVENRMRSRHSIPISIVDRMTAIHAAATSSVQKEYDMDDIDDSGAVEILDEPSADANAVGVDEIPMNHCTNAAPNDDVSGEMCDVSELIVANDESGGADSSNSAQFKHYNKMSVKEIKDLIHDRMLNPDGVKLKKHEMINILIHDGSSA